MKCGGLILVRARDGLRQEGNGHFATVLCTWELCKPPTKVRTRIRREKASIIAALLVALTVHVHVYDIGYMHDCTWLI